MSSSRLTRTLVSAREQGAKEPAGAKGAGAKAGEKASAKTSGDEVWSKETDYL